MGKCVSKTIEIADEIHGITFDINNINPDDVPNVPFKDEIIPVKIIRVYDGDTVHCLIPFDTVPVKLGVRLLGIDTPEMKAGKDRLKEEKDAAIICRDYLNELLKDGAKLIIRDWDKYARLLGELILPNGDNVVEILIKNGYGREYYGDKKKPWTLEELTSPPFC